MRAILLATVTCALAATTLAVAADHADSPTAAGDPAADIGDLYAWKDGSNVVFIVTFAGLAPAGGEATYDKDVLYGIHVDGTNDNLADTDMWFRFGQNGAGEWGVQGINLPGATQPVVGAVAETIEGPGGIKLYAGLRDDPFFFDQAGFRDTLSTGTLAIQSDRDSVASTNTTSIVVSVPAAGLAGGSNNLRIWSTTGRH